MDLSAFWVLLYPIIMLRAGIGDLMTMRIPNRLIVLLLAAYGAAVLATGPAWFDVAASLAVALAVFALGFLFFSLGWMGGGDVKLLSVATLWLGAANALPFIFYTSAFGALLTMALLLFRSAPLPAALRRRDWILTLHHRESGIPYGVAIAAAAILVYAKTSWVAAQI